MGLPQEQPSNKQVDIISRFKARYAEAIDDARVHAKHTETEGWKSLYCNFRKSQRDKLSTVAKSLRAKADTIELLGTNEDLEKEINEAKKYLTEIRAETNAFDLHTVQPVKQCTADCQLLISEAMSQSRRMESEAPLVNVGLEHLMRDAIAAVAKATWDDEAGVVIITEVNA